MNLYRSHHNNGVQAASYFKDRFWWLSGLSCIRSVTTGWFRSMNDTWTVARGSAGRHGTLRAVTDAWRCKENNIGTAALFLKRNKLRTNERVFAQICTVLAMAVFTKGYHLRDKLRSYERVFAQICTVAMAAFTKDYHLRNFSKHSKSFGKFRQSITHLCNFNTWIYISNVI